MKIQKKYFEKLNSMPAPGDGCHPALLGAANLGLMVGIPPEIIFADIRASIPYGKRNVSDNEIHDAINRAIIDNVALPNSQQYRRCVKPKAIIKDGVSALRRIIDQAKIYEEADLWEMSPIKIDWPPEEDTVHFLEAMFEPDDSLFLGERLESGIVGRNIRTSKDWVLYFQSGGNTAPFIIVNPLTGEAALKKKGEGVTYRGDGNIKLFRYCLVEFDNLTREEQIRFWSAARLPVACLIDSGGKSIHAWIDVQKRAKVETLEQWHAVIKMHLYDSLLAPLGTDKACSNPARLSRLPGHYRAEKENYQRILWLSGREGRFIG